MSDTNDQVYQSDANKQESTCFDSKDLIFTVNDDYTDLYSKRGSEGNTYTMRKNGVLESIEVIKYGTVLTFCTDRADDWQMFVALSCFDNKLSAIFPRIRVNSSDQIEMGEDTLVVTHHLPYKKCHCNDDIYQGCDFFCRCNATKYNRELYTATFKKVDTDYKYKIQTIDLTKHCIWTYLSMVKKNSLNYRDEP